MRISEHVAALALAAALACGAVSGASAQSDAARIVSEDAAMLFGELCIATRGSAERIDAAINKQRIQALPLSPDGVQSLLEGKPGDLGWIVRSERGTGLQLHLSGTTSCNMRAMETDDAAVNQVLGGVLEALSANDNFTVEKIVDERRATNGGEEHLVGYRLTWREVGLSANLGVSHIAGDGNDIPPQVNFMLALRQAI
jgi:hypothetical protein